MDMGDSDTSSNDLSLNKTLMMILPVAVLTILGILSVHVYGSHYYDADYCQNVHAEWIAAGNDPGELICDPLPVYIYPVSGVLFIIDVVYQQ